MVRSIPPTLRAGTPDLPAVPPWMQVWIILFLGPILTWAETRIYRLVLTQSADHPLVQLGLHYDPSAVVAACAGFHAAADGPGAPSTFTIEQLVRAEIVRAWAEACSDRDVEVLLVTNLGARWFVGLSLFTPRPPRPRHPQSLPCMDARPCPRCLVQRRVGLPHARPRATTGSSARPTLMPPSATMMMM